MRSVPLLFAVTLFGIAAVGFPAPMTGAGPSRGTVSVYPGLPMSHSGGSSLGGVGVEGTQDADHVAVAFNPDTDSYSVSDPGGVTVNTMAFAAAACVQQTATEVVCERLGPEISVVMGRGDDSLLARVGGSNRIWALGGFGRDEMSANAGDLAGGVRFFGERGADHLVGAGTPTGNSRLNGGDGADDLEGSSAVDLLVGGTGRDTFRGKGGNDVLRARDKLADRALRCGRGEDSLRGDAADPRSRGCEAVEARAG